MIEAIGFTAAILTSVAFLPQVVKTLRTRQAGDLSILTLLVQNAGVALWFTYGVALDSLPMIFGNGITLTLMLVLLVCKVRYS
ncbi:MAG: SemiSWEET family sugar transporter [Vicinamibacterales bacterium]